MTRQAPRLDRRATLKIAPAGRRNEYGEWTQDAPVAHEIWYALRDWDIAPDPTISGIDQTGEAEIITRYRRDVIVEAVSGDVSPHTGHAFLGWALVAETLSWSIVDASELPQFGRRRFMKLVLERATHD